MRNPLNVCAGLPPLAGVFSMDGTIAPLGDICALARKHGALVFVVRPQQCRRCMLHHSKVSACRAACQE
jgi:hypothetical protein